MMPVVVRCSRLGKRFFRRKLTDGPEGDAVGERDVADNISSHQPCTAVPRVGLEKANDLDGKAVRPWQQHVLLPPPLDHEADVESLNEHERDASKTYGKWSSTTI